ncbi:MAG: hypothetical protein SPK63_04625 [Eubacteriales bacterium]|nr:hypothetical protein [Eubacteriales bacterium]
MTNLLANISMLLSQSKRVVDTAQKVHEVLANIVAPCLTVLGSLAIMYVIVLGVQYAKSENDEKRAEVKKRIINTAIGAVAIIVLILLCWLVDWGRIIPQIFGYVDIDGVTGSSGGSSSSSGGVTGGGGTRGKPNTLGYISTLAKDLKFLFRV